MDAPALLQRTERAWRPAAQAGVELTLQLPTTDAPGPLLVNTDAQRLRQIIDGLIGNALRVTPPGKPVIFNLTVEDP